MPKFFLVIPNRYAHLDHLGRPAGCVIQDAGPDMRPGRPRYVGARFVAAPIEEKRSDIPNLNLPKQDSWLEYDASPSKVLDTDHHRAALRAGELFACDEATWRAVFPTKPFVPAETLLAAARTEAIEEWKREHSDALPSFAIELEAAPTEPPPPPSDTSTDPTTPGGAAPEKG